MAQIVAVHSFRRGTGKSTLVANLAVLLAGQGRQVLAVDTDILSPSLHVPFGLDNGSTLNDYLEGRCDVTQVIRAPVLPAGLKDRLGIVPAKAGIGPITRLRRQGYDPDRLSLGLSRLAEMPGLEVMLLDTHAGLNEESFVAAALGDVLLLILRPDQQDYQGTGMLVDVARQLKVPRLEVLVNEVPLLFDFATVQSRVEQAYHCPVAAVLPHIDELTALGSDGIFALHYPDHPHTMTLGQVAAGLVT